jgi:hypothetical protein
MLLLYAILCLSSLPLTLLLPPGYQTLFSSLSVGFHVFALITHESVHARKAVRLR